MKKLLILLLAVFLGADILCNSPTFALESYEEAEMMADDIHKTVATDIIYTEQELKALYYQNIQIIHLLKEIKELLQKNLQATREKK